ncbi:MAG: phosphatase PAP2 family protein [Dorea sp. 42_8]|nr:MAG: phosphatase PAP2 family protein [Dorea sp. 42_8]
MEIHILDMIQNLRTPIGDVVVPLITRLGDAGIIWIILTVLLLIIPKTRKTGVIMLAALLVDVLLCNVFIKNLVARTRPFDVNTAVQLLVAKPRDYSFPSGHTAASFASVTALYLAGEKKMWKAALVLAVLIALSRLYLYVHYPTDILGGIIVGIVAGYAAKRIINMYESHKRNYINE